MEALQLELQLNEERRKKAEEREAQEKEAEQRKRNKDKAQVFSLIQISYQIKRNTQLPTRSLKFFVKFSVSKLLEVDL